MNYERVKTFESFKSNMSVPDLLKSLRQRILDTSSDEFKGHGRRSDKFRTFEHLINWNEKPQNTSSLQRFVREELLVFEAETHASAEGLVEEVVSSSESGLAVVAMLLGCRASSRLVLLKEQSKVEDKLDSSVSWWKGQHFKEPEVDISLLDQIVYSSDRSFVSSKEDYVGDNESGFVNKKLPILNALDLLRQGDFSKVNGGVNEFQNLSIRAQSLEDRLSSEKIGRFSNVFYRILIIECENIIGEWRCSLRDQCQHLESLISMNVMLRPFDQVMTGLESIFERLVGSTNPCEAMDSLFAIWTQCNIDRRGIISKRLLDKGLEVMNRILVTYLMEDANSISDFVSIFPTDLGSGLGFGKKMFMPVFPEFLGGNKLGRRIGLIRLVGGNLVAENLDIDLPHGIERLVDSNPYLDLCLGLETRIIPVFRSSLISLLEYWREHLLFSLNKSNTRLPLKRDKSTDISVEFEDTLEKCGTILASIRDVTAGCVHVFEMYILLREFEAYLLQRIDFEIWPAMEHGIENGSSVEAIALAVDAGRLALVDTFLLNEDIHFLALENLLRAIKDQDYVRFYRTRSFFIKCLDSSANGRKLLDFIDHNGFYRKAAQTPSY